MTVIIPKILNAREWDEFRYLKDIKLQGRDDCNYPKNIKCQDS